MTSSYIVPCSYKEIRNADELHRNVVYQGVELLLLVSKLFLPVIPKSLLILKELELLYTIMYVLAPVNYVNSFCGFMVVLSSSLQSC